MRGHRGSRRRPRRSDGARIRWQPEVEEDPAEESGIEDGGEQQALAAALA
jgi:hypothetical protein